MKASEVKGHCQTCGRIQVVLSAGMMSKHGYKVRSGYFLGVCNGQDHLPLEQSRDHLDYIVSYLRREAVMHLERAERLRSGDNLPGKVISRSEPYGSVVYHSRHHDDVQLRGTAVMKQWFGLDTSDMERAYQLKMDIGHHESEAGYANSHANGLVELAAKVHGQPLINRSAEEMVKREKAAAKKAPIPGAFRTKAAQKEALESLSRQYEKQTRAIRQHYLEGPGRSKEGEEMYYQLPYQLNHFRPKHAALVRKVYPVLESAVVEIERLVIQREAIKAMAVIKA